MEKLKKFLDRYFFFVALAVSIPAVWALSVNGFYGASDEMHPAWLYEMYETIKAGQIPPRFVPDLSFAHGYPLFNFVFPLPFYIGSLVHLAGLSLVDSVKFLFFISVPLSAYFMYRLLRQFSNQFISFLGSMVYIYSPYRSTEIYVRGAIGEIFSFVFLPLILLSIVKTTDTLVKTKLKWAGLGALSIGGLILSHNIISYMFLPFAAFFALLRLRDAKYKKEAGKDLLMMALFGLLISGYFWIPAIVESSQMKYSTVFNYWDHFPALRQLITPYFGYGASVPGRWDGISFFVGSAALMLMVISLVIFAFKAKKIETEDKGLILWSITAIVISVFMMNHRSDILWRNVPLLPYFQFPWRFLALVSFAGSLLVVSIKYLPLNKLLGFILLLLTLSSIPYFKPHDFLGRTDDYFLKRYVPYPALDPLYLTQNEEYLRLPRLTEKLMYRRGLHPVGDGVDQITIRNDKRLEIEAEVITSADIKMNYGKYYFPGCNRL